jgi:hypothetical protein
MDFIHTFCIPENLIKFITAILRVWKNGSFFDALFDYPRTEGRGKKRKKRALALKTMYCDLLGCAAPYCDVLSEVEVSLPKQVKCE